MEALHLVTEQVNFEATDLPLHWEQDLDPMSSVVEPNTDFDQDRHLTFQPTSSRETFNVQDFNTVVRIPVEEKSVVLSAKKQLYLDFDKVKGDVKTRRDMKNLPKVHERSGIPVHHHQLSPNLEFSGGGDGEHSDTKSSPSTEPIYPAILSEVAQYLCQSNPMITQEVEAALSSPNCTMDPSPHIQPPNPRISKSNFGPTVSMLQALSLQESVIGSRNVEPASPEEVAAVVAKVRHKALINENSKSSPKRDGFSNKNAETEAISSNSTLAAETAEELMLHRFPSERITTVTERRGWFSSVSQDGSIDAGDSNVGKTSPTSTNFDLIQVDHNSQNSNLSSPVNITSPMDFTNNGGKFTSTSALPPSGLSSKADWEMMMAAKDHRLETRSNNSELESNYSDRLYELDSNYSDRLETQSNFSMMSGASGIEEEMFRIRKLLLDVPSIPDDHPDFHKHCVVLGKTAGVIVGSSESRTVVDQEVYFELQREKANLEGQLEALKEEMADVSKERVSLQTQLATTRAQAKTQLTEIHLANNEKIGLTMRADELQRTTRESESVVSQLRSGLEVRLAECERLKEELRDSEELGARLHLDVEQLKLDLQSRDGAVRGLKAKVAELHTDVEKAEQARIQSEADVRCSRNELEAAQRSRDWYQEQLHSTQEARTKLQQEMVFVRAEGIAARAAADKQQMELAQGMQQLTEVQQRAVREKEVLLRHLETVEADMVERESLFDQMQRDQGTSEEILTARMRKLDEDRAKMTGMMFKLTDMEQQLETAKRDAAGKKEAQQQLERTYADLTCKLAIEQKSANEKELELHGWQERCRQLEQEASESSRAAAEREQNILDLKREKGAAEVALSSAVREKREVDEALQDMRSNLFKLDSGFRKIKDEMASKSAAVEQLNRDKQGLEEEVKLAHQQIASFQRYQENYEAELKRKQEAVAATGVTDKRLEEELIRINAELALSNDQRRSLEDQLALMKDEMEIISSESMRLKINGKNSDDANRSLNEEILAVRKKLAETLAERESREKKHIELLSGKNDVEVIDVDISKVTKNRTKEDAVSVQSANNRSFEDEFELVKMKLSESEKQGRIQREARIELERKLESLTGDNKKPIKERSEHGSEDEESPDEGKPLARQIEAQLEVYKRKVVELQGVLQLTTDSAEGVKSAKESYSHADTQTDNVTFMQHVLEEDGKRSRVGAGRELDLEAALEASEMERTSRQKVYESNVKVLIRKLKEAVKMRKNAETELKQIQTSGQGNGSTTDTYPSTIPEPVTNGYANDPKEHSTATPTLLSKSKDPKRQILHYRAQVKRLQIQLAELQDLYEQTKNKANANERLALNLEKEKGKLSGVSQSNVALKQQTSQLEAALVEKTSAASELNLTTRDLVQRRQEEDDRAKQRVSELEDALKLEKDNVKDIRRQLFGAKREASALRKQMSSFKTGLDGANQLAEVRGYELQTARAELERRDLADARLKGEMEMASSERKRMAAELDRLRQQTEVNREKDPMLAEQIKSLSWHLREKNQEIDALKERLSLSAQVQQVELQGLQKSIEATKEELANVKAELSICMKEKFLYQNKVTELRTALKTSFEQNKVLRSKLSVAGLTGTRCGNASHSGLDLTLPESPAPYDESFISTLLQQSAVIPQSRPLNNLQACLNTLKQEMEVLQKQLQEQTEVNAPRR